MSDSKLICNTLSDIFVDIKSGKLEVAGGEDIHMFVESVLTSRIGDIGKKLHTARSRNDQVALDIRLYLRDSITAIITQLKSLITTITNLAAIHTDTIIAAYTHMQKAQPTTLAHHMLAYVDMFFRDIDRLRDCNRRVNVMPLGSGACCATSYPINRNRVAELLNFDKITTNSIDAVSDRDFAIEYLSALSIIMMHLSRYNEEIIYWATDEFGYIQLDDQFSTGSSIMPQKKNPDMSELIRGKTGRVYGDLMSMMTVMKGLPLAYNKDMQEDKECLFDAEDTVRACLKIFTAMLPTLKYNKERLYHGANGGYTVATDCADYLVRKGMPFRDAHSVIGKLVRLAISRQVRLDELEYSDFQSLSTLFEPDIHQIIRLENVISSRKIIGGANKETVIARINEICSTLTQEY